MTGSRFSYVRPLLWAAVACVGAPLLGAEDDEVVEGPIAVEVPQEQRHFVEQNFDQLLFQPNGNAKQAIERMKTQVDLQLAELDRIGQLTPEQRQKLELAAHGDLKRFLMDADVLRRKFQALKGEQNAINQMWQEIQPLQQRQSRGLTGPGSLLARTIPKTLTPEQATQYDAVTYERRLFRYKAGVGVALHTLEAGVALKHEQREAVTKLLMELPPPKAFGQYDHYLIMYRLGNVPPERIKPLLDDRQWEALKKQLDQYRGMKAMLIDQGFLFEEDVNVQPPQARAAEDKP